MLRILIVDDEPFFLDMLSGFLDWESHGATLAGTAENGLRAMQFLQKNRVDVIITDIKMPVMGGLELICDALEQNPDQQFVVLSSYSDFHMVEEAFRLGVKEYALKSEITKDQLIRILGNCKLRRDQHRLQQQKNEEQIVVYKVLSGKVAHLERLFQENQMVVKNTFFNAALDRDEPVETLPEFPQAAQFGVIEAPTALLLVTIDDYGRIIRDAWETDHRTFEIAVTNVLEEVVFPHRSLVVFTREQGRYVVLFGGAGSESALRELIHVCADNIRENLREYLKLDVILSTSNVKNFRGGFGELYHQARQAGRGFYLAGKDRLLAWRPFSDREESVGFDERLNAMVQSFHQLLLTKNITQLQKELSSFQIETEGIKDNHIADIKRLFQRYAFYLSEYMEQNSGSERAALLLDDYESMLSRYGTLQDMNRWLEEIVTILLQMEYGSTNLIRRVRKYILAHYPEEINLTILAETMGVNPSYLSRSFSKAEGESLTTYINKIRVQAAIRLLQDTGCKLYEISDQVGYKNVEHFSRVFRKIVGKSPREYLSS